MPVATLLATAALLGPAGVPAERLCTPASVVPRATRLEMYQQARRGFGFRSDAAYVRLLVRRDRWAFGGWIPVTRAEQRYLRLRERLTLGKAAERYLRRRPAIDGGVSIEDGWPREPSMLVRLTRDRERHAAALRRRAAFPANLRTQRVAVSERALRRIQDGIDFDAHGPDGFHVVSTGVDIWRNAVEIGVITARDDHLAYFRERYGPHVVTDLVAREPTSLACTDLFGVRPGATDAELELVYESGGGAVLERTEVVEHEDRVEVGVVVRQFNGPTTADSQAASVVVALAAPLGERRVVDARTGKPLRPLGARGRAPLAG